MPAKAFHAQDVHAAADAAGVKWDNNKAFMDLSERLTGKRHLDDMTESELRLVANSLVKRRKTPVPLLPLAGGIAGGVLYFATAEKHVGKKNCSWRDPLTTDIASLVIGSYLAWRGTVLREPLIAVAGAAMVTIHTAQLLHEGRA
jgi:hypothetical protein